MLNLQYRIFDKVTEAYSSLYSSIDEVINTHNEFTKVYPEGDFEVIGYEITEIKRIPLNKFINLYSKSENDKLIEVLDIVSKHSFIKIKFFTRNTGEIHFNNCVHKETMFNNMDEALDILLTKLYKS